MANNWNFCVIIVGFLILSYLYIGAGILSFGGDVFRL